MHLQARAGLKEARKTARRAAVAFHLVFHGSVRLLA